MTEERDVNLRGSEPWRTEESWQSLAIASSVLLLVASIWAATWIILAPDNGERLLRVQISAPFGVFGGACVTFFTVVWRGLILKRQADAQLAATLHQKDQIEKIAEQISATDEQNRSRLLLDGAAMLASDEPQKVAAGIAALRAVGAGKGPAFRSEAMDLLADYVSENGTQTHALPNVRRAVEAMRAVSLHLEKPVRHRLVFEAVGLQATEDWQLVQGVRDISYRGGRLSNEEIVIGPVGTRFRFQELVFSNCTIDVDPDIDRDSAHANVCSFHDCRIVQIPGWWLDQCNWYNCDFSGARISTSVMTFPELARHSNWFFESYPPIFAGSERVKQWSPMLVEKALPIS